MSGTEKHSIASKLRWAKIPVEKRSELMSKLAKSKAAMMTPEQRSAHAKLMRSKRK